MFDYSNENIISIFTNICTWARDISSIPVIIEQKDTNIYSLQYECLNLVQKLVNNESTEFMVAPIVEYYFNILTESMVFPAKEMMNGDFSKLKECNTLREILSNHPVKDTWNKKSAIFKEIAAKAGYILKNTDYKDIATIAPIISDALTFPASYSGKRIYKVREGSRSGEKPVMMNDIAIFNSVSEAVQLFERLKEKAFIGFFGVQKTYQENIDSFEIWKYGKDIRKENLKKNCKLTDEDYKNGIDEYSKTIYSIIKDGENIWLIKPSFDSVSNPYSSCYSKNSFISTFGRRMTYFPVQILFNIPPKANAEDMALIPFSENHWKLTGILDEEQKVWLPIYFYAISKIFFGEKEPDCKYSLMKQESVLVKNTSNLPAIRNVLPIPTPEEVFSDTQNDPEAFLGAASRFKFKNSLELIRLFNITVKNIENIPFTLFELSTKEEQTSSILKQAAIAYEKIIEEKAREYVNKGYPDAQNWYHSKIEENIFSIIKRCVNKEIPFSKVIIDKAIVYDEDGVVKTYHDYITDEDKPLTYRTNIDDSKHIRRYHKDDRYEYRNWFPKTLIDKKPPVTITIKPKTIEQIALILKIKPDELPELMKYHDILNAYLGEYSRYNITINLNKTEFKKIINSKAD